MYDCIYISWLNEYVLGLTKYLRFGIVFDFFPKDAYIWNEVVAEFFHWL